MQKFFVIPFLLCSFGSAFGESNNHLVDVFSPGWMLQDTNQDSVVDFIKGHVVVPAHPSAAENAAAANIAARLGFLTTGLTPPLVITTAAKLAAEPHVYIGQNAVPSDLAGATRALVGRLHLNEGGVFVVGDDLVVLGQNEAGLLAAGNCFSSRAPFIWRVPGDTLSSVATELNRVAPKSEARLVGLVYASGKAGVARVLLSVHAALTSENLKVALRSPSLAAVHELATVSDGREISAINAKPLPVSPAAPVATGASGSGGGETGTGGEAEGATPQPLDLSIVYTSKGFFRGSAKMPIPSSLDTQLVVGAGEPGTAMANLAARMGLETTGLSLPLARPESEVAAKDLHGKIVALASSPAGAAVAAKLAQEDTTGQAQPALASGEGELRIVDRAFGKQSALLVRGDTPGAAAALQVLSDRLPSLWEPGKQYASLEELRYDLHRFFSLRSGVGQAAVALYHLDQWAGALGRDPSGPPHDVKAEIDVDLADEGLKAFVTRRLSAALHTEPAEVKVASLHAGTKCCAQTPALHYEQPGLVFHQSQPTFTEDFTIPWEGTRLLDVVHNALPDIRRDQKVRLVARVSEGPDIRRKLAAQLAAMLQQHGVPADHAEVTVLCAFKQGYSWLLDSVAPELKSKPVARIKIEFAKDVDPTGLRLMYSPARWVQELYPVDEMLGKELNLPLENVELSEFDPAPDSPTYRVHAYDGSGAEIFSSDFSVKTAMRAYNGVIPRYEQVQVETGWVSLQCGNSMIVDKRIDTDEELFWSHYQEETLPQIYRLVMSQAKGDIRPEFAPLFDTLRIDIQMSEPDYALGLDKERISSLEALQEDTFYSTENFVNILTNLESGHPENYVGRIIPVVHASRDGKDGTVHVEFYGKAAANPVVRLSWTGSDGQHHETERDLPAIAGPMLPRLVRARVKNGQDGFENLTWNVPADYLNDDFDEWVKLEPRDAVERSVFSAAQAKGQLHWLNEMHRAGLYRDELAYPHLRELGFEFELPVPLSERAESPAPRSYAGLDVAAPLHPRPMIGQAAAGKASARELKWNEPIGPDENVSILTGLAKHPGVNVYWMGRSYLGRDIWAADITTPAIAQLRSWPKETTLKASIIYSGRQHANEVSSTSHIDELGVQLVSDPATEAMLKQVNVILHPIDNPDGAEMAMALAEITPDNLLHPGYHGSLAADVAAGQTEPDPVYPESRTRRQLLESWLPDAFLNPHGYPSHEWIQPFSEYTGWVQNREQANPGRAWWIPRGWFTSLTYLRDFDHPYSQKITYELRDRIVEAERGVPGLLPLETRMNDRYKRFGQRWQPKDITQPIVKGIRIYMALKGTPAPKPGSDSQRSGAAIGGISPDVTWDAGYTEAPDETAHGDYLELMASAGLAFDRVHLSYLANGKLRIKRTPHEAGEKVVWQVSRDRPNLPLSEAPAPAQRKAE